LSVQPAPAPVKVEPPAHGLKIVKPNEIPLHINFMIIGDPGMGKTVLAATAPKPLFVDCEGGMLSIRNRSDIDVITLLPDEETKEKSLSWAKSAITTLKKIYDMLALGGHPYETVVIDSLSELSKIVMISILEDVMASSAGANRDPDVPAIRDWGKLREQMGRIVRSFRNLPINTVFTSLVSEINPYIEDSKGNISANPNSKLGPALAGKMAEEIPGYLDVVGFMYVEESIKPGSNPPLKQRMRKLLVQPYGKVLAKDRSDALGQTIECPQGEKDTLTKVFATIQKVGWKNTPQ
jgi:AAA domain